MRPSAVRVQRRAGHGPRAGGRAAAVGNLDAGVVVAACRMPATCQSAILATAVETLQTRSQSPPHPLGRSPELEDGAGGEKADWAAFAERAQFGTQPPRSTTLRRTGCSSTYLYERAFRLQPASAEQRGRKSQHAWPARRVHRHYGHRPRITYRHYSTVHITLPIFNINVLHINIRPPSRFSCRGARQLRDCRSAARRTAARPLATCD